MLARRVSEQVRRIDRTAIFTLTCEDATTEAWTTDFFMGAGMRLDEGGEFAFEEDFDFMYFAMDGAIGFRHASVPSSSPRPA